MKNRIELRNQVTYQIFVRQFSETHDFNGVIKELDRIKELGVDIIYLLPFFPVGKLNRKGSVGSPYSIKNYKEIDPLNGSLEELKVLIDETHKRGMKIIIDMVLNHTSRDSLFVNESLDYMYLVDGKICNKVGDWSDVADINYNNDVVIEKIIDALEYWAKLGIDGYRMDVCSLIPSHFWNKAVKRLREINDDVIMLGESVGKDFILYLRSLGHTGLSDSELYQYFDVLYPYDIKDYQDDFIANKKNLEKWLFSIKEQQAIYPLDFVKARYLSNHDLERIGSYYRKKDLEKIWAFNFFLPGLTFIYAGDEFGEDIRQTLFEIEEIDWEKKNYDLTKLFKVLSQIKKADIYREGFFDYEVINDVAILKYLQNGNVSYGIFNFGNQSSIKTNIKDGTYINKITGEKIIVKDGIINISDYFII
jgi:glycosidase